MKMKKNDKKHSKSIKKTLKFKIRLGDSFGLDSPTQATLGMFAYDI